MIRILRKDHPQKKCAIDHVDDSKQTKDKINVENENAMHSLITLTKHTR